ncbi:MAG: hypothetical protein ISS79_08120, partial [Phycisphaerae bacterium]|nr:hypothetical protein [Phycisphaerae bacterium]
MLSADSLLIAAVPDPFQDTLLDGTQQVVERAAFLETDERLERQLPTGEQAIRDEVEPSDQLETDLYQPIFTLSADADDATDDEPIDADVNSVDGFNETTGDVSFDEIGPVQASEDPGTLVHDSDGATQDTGTLATVTEAIVGGEVSMDDDAAPAENSSLTTDTNDADLSIEYATSIEIRGPPASDPLKSNSTSVTLVEVAFQTENNALDEYKDGAQRQGVDLPGLYLVDPDVGYFDGQVIYLDFDGAQDITYNGPIVVEDIDIPEFSVDAAGLAGQEQQIISEILFELEQTFQGSGVVFTSTAPDAGTEYSTIFIGGDDSAFCAYGQFWGLAEKVDVGNQDPSDNAFVFSEVIVSCGLDREAPAKSLADAIAHETGHLLGYCHDSSGSNGGVLGSVAINLSEYGGEFLINVETAGDQVNVSVDANAAGNYVAVWQGANVHGWGTNEIYLQRYNAEGTPLGPEQQVNPDWHGEQTNPDVAVADDGTFVVTWTTDNDGDSYGVHARLFEADGTPVSDAFLVNTYTDGNQSDSEVAINPTTGEFVAVWASEGQDGFGWGVYGQRFAADGTPVGDEFRVNTYTNGDQSNPVVAMDADGDFVVTWQSYGQDQSWSWGIYGQRFALDGTAQDSEFQVNTYTNSTQQNPALGFKSDGSFIIVWDSDQDGSGHGIYAQEFLSDGTREGGEFLVNTYTSNTQAGPAIAMDTDGSHVIAWHSYGQDGSVYGVYAQGYASDGTALGGEFRANTYTNYDQHTPAVAIGADGDFLIAWQSRYQDGSGWGIYGQLYGEGLEQAELVPVKVSAPKGANLGQTINVSAEIRNQGGVDAGSFACRYYLSIDPIITVDDTALSGLFTVEGLDAYETHTDSRQIQILSDTPTGDFYVGLLVDVDNEVVESDETNNGTATVEFPSMNVRSLALLGDEFRVNRYISGDQVNVSVDADAAGNYVAVWQGANVHGWGTNDIYLQRYNAEGTPVGLEQQVNPDWHGEQTNPDVAVADDGTFVVTWTTDDDGDGQGIEARIFAADGAPLTDAFLVNTYTAGNQSDSEVAINPATGEFVVVWASSGQDGSGWGVYGQRFAANGTPVGEEFRVNTHTDNDQSNPAVAMDVDGDFIVTWQSNGQDGSSWGVYGQRFAADGTAVGGEFQVNTYTSSEQRNAAVAMETAGNFVVAWQSYGQDGSDWGVYAQRYAADGTAQGGEFLVNTYTSNSQAGPAIAFDTDGSHIIAWYSYGQDGSRDGVYGQGYASDGTTLGGEFRANTHTDYDQYAPAIAIGADGDFLIAWQSQYQDRPSWDWGIYGQLYGEGLSQADLVPVRVSAPEGANLGQTINVSAQIRNQGGADAGSFTCRYYLSDDPIITVDDTPLGGLFTVAGLDAYTTHTDSRQIQVSLAAPIGAFYVGLLIDVNNEVAEADETNNGTPAVEFSAISIRSPPPPMGGEFRINLHTGGDQVNVSVDADAAGNYVAVWQGTNVHGWGTNEIYLQRYNAEGTPIGPEQQVNPNWHGEQTNPDVAVADDGTFVVTWTTDNDGDSYGVHARLFDADGTPVSDAFLVNTYTDGNQSDSEVAIHPSIGEFTVVWA